MSSRFSTAARAIFSAGASFAFLSLTACDKHSQEAVVLSKDHIAAHVPGTPETERQLDKEQWLVHIRMNDGRLTDAPVSPELWKSLKEGDHVQADYSEGQYSRSIWAIEVRKR